MRGAGKKGMSALHGIFAGIDASIKKTGFKGWFVRIARENSLDRNGIA